MNRVARWALVKYLKQASSQVPGDLSNLAVRELGPVHLDSYGNFPTLSEERDAPEGSLYELNVSEHGLAKSQNNRAVTDHVDWSNFRVRLKTPVVPSYIRR